MTDERQTDNNLPNNETDQENPPETARWVILSFIAGLIVAALALEYYGYIVHPNKNDQDLYLTGPTTFDYDGVWNG